MTGKRFHALERSGSEAVEVLEDEIEDKEGGLEGGRGSAAVAGLWRGGLVLNEGIRYLKWVQNCDTFLSLCGSLFGPFLGPFLDSFWDSFLNFS